MGYVKVARYREFTLLKGLSVFIWSKTAERERGELKVITPGKIVPYKCCLSSWNISAKKDFYTDILLTNVVTHFQLLSVTCIEYGQNVNKHDIS